MEKNELHDKINQLLTSQNIVYSAMNSAITSIPFNSTIWPVPDRRERGMENDS